MRRIVARSSSSFYRAKNRMKYIHAVDRDNFEIINNAPLNVGETHRGCYSRDTSASFFASEKNSRSLRGDLHYLHVTRENTRIHTYRSRIHLASYDFSLPLSRGELRKTAKAHFPRNERRRASLIQISVTASGISRTLFTRRRITENSLPARCRRNRTLVAEHRRH